MSNWERRAEASTGGQVEEESTRGEDGQCDLEDENLIIVVVVCVVFGCLLGMYAAKK
jgi:hypothetical protein